MYRKKDKRQMEFEDFYLPFGGKLKSENRWVKLAKQIPWDEIEQEYAKNFSSNKSSSPGKNVRLALGSLIIKEHLNISDREVVNQIEENPFLQYFIGLSEYRSETPFDHSMLTHFRKRFNKESLSKINEMIVKIGLENQKKESPSNNKKDDDNDNNNPPTKNNKGKLIVDATCAPADVSYPTDLNLLNEAREKTEEIIDAIHHHKIGKKPRTYRIKAKKEYLKIAKKKSVIKKMMRKAIGKQLRYIKRNIGYISTMSAEGYLIHLNKKQYRNLLVINELYRQQLWMYENRTHKIEGRIISISQPHIRPIVRGKAGKKVEFGAKVSISVIEGYSFVDTISWNPYNESSELIEQIERYRARTGYYPESVHADKIYRTRKNRFYCTEHQIRFSGPSLGRPPKVTEENKQELKNLKTLSRQDELDRICVEGKFGQAKRRFGLGRVMAKLALTSEVSIMISFLVMNLEKVLSFFVYFLSGRIHTLMSTQLFAVFDLFKGKNNSDVKLFSHKKEKFMPYDFYVQGV